MEFASVLMARSCILEIVVSTLHTLHTNIKNHLLNTLLLGAYSGSNKPEDRGKGDTWESTGRRTIYAYTLNDDYTLPINKQVLYFAGNGATDGVRAAANGYIVTATGDGLDVITATGRLLVRVQTTFPVQNFIWTGKDFDSLWLTGKGGIAKVELNLPGQILQ
jgi:hypothetical protein